MHMFQVSLLAVSFALCSGKSLDKAPYLPSGWRPKGPAFDLPTETKKPIAPTSESIPELKSEGSSFLREYGPPNLIVGSIQASINPVQSSVNPVKDLVNRVQDSMNNSQASINQIQDSINKDQDLLNHFQGSFNQLQGSVNQIQDSESPFIEREPEIIPEDVLQDLTVQALPDVEVHLNFRNDLIQEEYTNENESEIVKMENVTEEQEPPKNGEDKVNFDVVLVNDNTEKTILSKTEEVNLEAEKEADTKNTQEKSNTEPNVPVGFEEYGPPKSSPNIIQDPAYKAPIYLPLKQSKISARRVRVTSSRIRNLN